MEEIMGALARGFYKANGGMKMGTTKGFLVPNNDAEAHRIIEILKSKPGVKVWVTNQQWGASWDKVESKIMDEIYAHDGHIWGVELQGKCPSFPGRKICHNIDHHVYENDDRSNSKSSIQQVAGLIGYNMSNYDLMISINDTHYIDGMKSIKLYKPNTATPISDEEREALIIQVRALDRKCQGISETQEKQAINSIENNMEVIGDTIIVKSKHSKCACYTDRLFGKYKRLLVLSEDGESNFFGDQKTIETLFSSFQGWKGGDIDNDSGYWGGYDNQSQIKEIVLKQSK